MNGIRIKLKWNKNNICIYIYIYVCIYCVFETARTRHIALHFVICLYTLLLAHFTISIHYFIFFFFLFFFSLSLKNM